MNTVELFQYESTQLRTPVIDGEPWFVAADVAKILEFRDAHNLVRGLDDEDRGTQKVSTPSGTQEVTIISEPGLYAAIVRSNSERVKPFKWWLTHEVLPAIRKTGGYSLVPKSLPEALRAYATEVEAHEATRAELEQAAPAAAAWDALADADGDYSLRDAAQILSRDPAITTGQNRLMVSIRQMRMVDNTGQPYQKHIEHLRLRVTSYEHPHSGEPVLSKQVRITVHGLKYLHKRLGGTQPLRLNPTIDRTPLTPASNRN